MTAARDDVGIVGGQHERAAVGSDPEQPGQLGWSPADWQRWLITVLGRELLGVSSEPAG